MAGGKGGSTTSSVTIPEYIEEAARRNLAKAEGISQIGYVPYYGPDVAAFTPFQQAGFQQTADVASAFGLGTPTTQADVMGGMPEPTEFAGGVRGYSAAPLYQQAVDELAAQRPAQAQYIESFFIDPVTGQAGTRVQPAVDYSTMGTIADIRAADRANELAIAQAQAAAGPESVYNFTPSTEVLVGPTSVGVGGTTVGGQEVQYYNPDIDYGDAFTAESGQQVGVLDPNQAALDAMQTEAGVDPSFYTETPIYSASDFPLGSSLSGTDYTTYAPDADESSYATNEFGSTVSSGYDIGQVDPRLAAAEGYTPAGVATPEIDYGAYLTPVSQPTSSDPIADAQSSNSQYTGFIDMIDGGGPNASGGPFEGGGLLSDAANFMAQGGVIGGVVRALEDALGIGPSASDFPLGSSLSGTDYTTYAPDADESSYVTNEFGSTVSAGYDVGQVDPALAAAAGYTAAATPAVPATSVSLDNPLLMGSTARAGAVQTSNPNVSVVSTPSGNQYFGTPVGKDPVTGATRYRF